MTGRVLVIGGGPAGMMAAGRASELGAEVILVERNEKLGRKLGITGKGRCNVTNDCDTEEFLANVPRNPRFLYGALARFGPDDTRALLARYGVATKVERGNRVFPESDRAADVVNALRAYCAGAKRVTGRAAHVIIKESRACGAELEDGRKLSADAVIVATGGLSYPATGSTGDGYALARECGHTVTSLRASLCGMTSADRACADCSGLTLKNIAATFYERGKKVYSDFGELLFTHVGISGPCVLSASAHFSGADGAERRAEIDLKPGLDAEKLDARILRDVAEAPNRDVATLVRGLVPSSLVPHVLDKAGVAHDVKCSSLTRAQRTSIESVLKKFRIELTGMSPIDEAVVTCGGVQVKELDSKTMESKLVKSLYFIGELVDVDAYTGGYNIQIALATGRLAGESAAENMTESDANMTK